jgi:hypothetical protein
VIFQPAIIALLFASGLGLAMLVAAAPFAWQVVRRWNLASGSELQLTLERRTYLFSTLLAFVFAAQTVALLLFVYNADRMSTLFVGAMCAVGALNANAWGFPALIAQIALFFLAAVWLAINHIDTLAPDYPLVRVKYALLIALAPALAATFALQLKYFLNLDADIITSCCGSLFSGEAKSLAAEVSALAPRPAMALFYGALAAAVIAAVMHARNSARGWTGYLLAGASSAAFAAAIAGIVAFVSLYVYEHPHHHCPFCLLKPEYDWQGYWLYLPLFGATAAGLAAGAVQPFRRIESLRAVVPEVSAKLAAAAMAGFLFFAAAASAMVLRSNLLLIE